MVVDVALMLMLPLEILMALVGVLYGRMVVLMLVFCHQVLHLAIPAFDVMGKMDMFMSMDYFSVSVLLQSGGGHGLPPGPARR